MYSFESCRTKVHRGERLSTDDVRGLFLDADSQQLAELATVVRGRYHPPKSATYIIMAIINYTNVCVAKCGYCAFYRLPHQDGTYLLTVSEIATRIDRLLDLGGTLVGFNGGFHPKLSLEHYADLFGEIRQRYGDRIEFYGMTVAEFMFSCKRSRIPYAEGARLLKSKGSRWVTGGGAEILDDGFRQRHSPGKYSVDDFFAAQSALVQSGLRSTATMVIGFDETLDERFNHLSRLRAAQDQWLPHERLPSFLCWTYKPYHTQLGGREIGEEEYLRWLAVCRIFLDNFRHIRTSVLTQNENALRGLEYGADDFDLPTEDEVTEKAGATISLDFDRLLSEARRLGFEPVMRGPLEA